MHLGMILLPGIVFVTAFVVALVMLRAAGRAFVIASVFTAGMGAGTIAALIGFALFSRALPALGQSAWTFLLVMTTGAVGGAALALYALGRFSKYPPWRRY